MRKLRIYLSIAIAALFLSVSFNNCAQPKFTELESVDGVGSAGDGDQDGGGGQEPGSPTLVTKSKLIDIQESEKLDVLVVIDNSGSMEYEQKNMGERFDSFMNQIADLDWRVGIVTTDHSGTDAELKHGRLIKMDGLKGKRWMDKATESGVATATFKATIQRSEEGSGSEQGVRSAYRAVERDAANDYNYGFFRSDAALAIVVVTDADETPNKDQLLGDFNSPAKLIKLISDRWSGKAVLFNAIIVRSGDNACLSDKPDGFFGNEGYGKNYEKAAGLTGGILGSVCEQDYASQLSSMGTGASQLVKSVGLECSPVDGDLNGVLDIEVRDSMGQVLSQSEYSVAGSLVTFKNVLPTGRTTITYNCYQ